MVIRQNGPELQKISRDLESVKREIEARRNDIFEDMKRNMGDATETGKIWYGPRAAGCLREALKGVPTYEAMERALKELADKVNSDAVSWGNQQTRKY